MDQNYRLRYWLIPAHFTRNLLEFCLGIWLLWTFRLLIHQPMSPASPRAEKQMFLIFELYVLYAFPQPAYEACVHSCRSDPTVSIKRGKTLTY